MPNCNKAQFVEALINSGLSAKEAEEAFRTIMTCIETTLIAGDKVILKNIGTLEPTVVAPRVLKIYGKEVESAHKMKVKFTMSRVLNNKARETLDPDFKMQKIMEKLATKRK